MSIKLFDLTGKVAVVTGGTGVLGSAMAKGLAEAGAHVVILGRRKEAGDLIASDIAKLGVKSICLQADVLDKSRLIAVRDEIKERLGSIDILVNAAGGNMPGAVVAPDKTIFDLNIDDFQKVVDLNFLGTVLPTQVFSEHMAAKKQGVIVNIASMASIKPITRVVGYSAAKAAVDNFTKWLAVEMANKFGEGIRANAISPGYFLTEQNRTLLTNPDGSLTPRSKLAIAQTPFARFGKPEELVGTLIWLCSDSSKFVTGINVPVDGGFSAYCGV
ncbi:MAG TPA: SDR family oxidoreductase [Chryseolinea sp.]|nr:SDR family oxidoreductase [Chryseolinea sp.]HPM32535.1 SDR family oxidoreductase [Chryseolinea sp.]